MLVAICHADTAGFEETCQPTFCAAPPADPLPLAPANNASAAPGGLIGNMVFAGLSYLRDGKNQIDVRGINILATRQTHRPQQTPRAQSLTEGPAGAIS